jgi:heat-inducible transcriptional repressor
MGRVIDEALDGVEAGSLDLDERQSMVLRALVSTYVADAAPVSSGTLSHLLPVALSSASIRATMSELATQGLIEKPHASSGRIPTQAGFRHFLDHLMQVPSVSAYERRGLEEALGGSEGDALIHQISAQLSNRTRQLGFALKPNVERLALAHVSLVRVSSERVMVVLVARSGQVVQRIVDERGQGDQSELERMAHELNERVSGRTLPEVHAALACEIESLRDEADRVVARALSLGLRAVAAGLATPTDLVVATRLAIFNQPEFNDPERIKGILAALETNQRLLEVLEQVLEGEGVSVSLGDELAEPGLRDCALVAVPYGGLTGASESSALGVLGVIGPNRMDYSRIIPLVRYCSQLVTEKLNS